MTERSKEDRIARTIKENYQEAEMDTVYRQSILGITRARVATVQRRRGYRLALLVGTGLLAAAGIFLISNMQKVTPTSLPRVTAVAPRITGTKSTPARGTIGGKSDRNFTSRPHKGGGLPSGGGKAVQLAGMLVGLSSKSRYNSDLVVTSVESKATDGRGKPLRVGDHIVGAATIVTDIQSRISLITKNGSQIYLAPSTRLVLKGDGNTSIKSGRIYCINRKSDFASIDTSAAHLKLLGTTVDTAVLSSRKTAVTVVEGKVQATNSHGSAIVNAGTKAVLMADASPVEGESINTTAETSWYDGRGKVVSPTGQLSYSITRKNSQLTEFWTMNSDGSGKRLVKAYLGYVLNTQWLGRKLMINLNSKLWTTPDQVHRSADAGSGHPIIKGQLILLDTVTGQDVRLSLPAEYNPLYVSISPDSTKVAVVGSYSDGTKAEGGIWVFDIASGETKKVFDGWIKTAPAWSPDNRYVISSTGEGYGTNYPLAIADIQTGQVRDLKTQGAGAAFSPDGKKIAYCGGFKGSGSWMQGVPASGSVYVMDLETGVSQRVSPEGEGALQPSWSPDGSRILYCASHSDDEDSSKWYYELFTVDPSGNDQRSILKRNGMLNAAEWSKDGRSVIVDSGVMTKSKDGDSTFGNAGTLLVNAAGSGSTNVGGTEADSILPANIKSQMDAASKDVKEGIFDYAMTQIRLFEARRDDLISAKRLSEDSFAQLIWKHPLANLSALNTLAYADAASKISEKSEAETIADSCKMRLEYLRWELGGRFGKPFAADLQSLEPKITGSGGAINWLRFANDPQAEAWTHMLFHCPLDGTLFTYNSPTDSMKDGDVVLTCPNHPQNKIVWDKTWRR